MNKSIVVLIVLSFLCYGGCQNSGVSRIGSTRTHAPGDVLRMHESELRDRIEGAWLGQMIGVTWGFPTEFYGRYIWQLFPDFHQVNGVARNIYAKYEGGPIPLEELPEWRPEMINGAYTQDDLYVEVPFIDALQQHGVNAGWEHFGHAFAQTVFPLYHANAAARKNLQSGLDVPWSGHYSNGGESDDIDWQIEADFVGLIHPGQLHSAAELAFRAGHVMNYGDGVYGGVFVATMIAKAFSADSIRDIVDAGRLALPLRSQYRQLLDEVVSAFDQGMTFDSNLAAINDKWGHVDRCAEWGGVQDPLNIDAKLNGAYILLGLLYGGGDLAASMRYAMACGQDSDCNPSNVGSVLGALYGTAALSDSNSQWFAALDRSRTFQTTTYRLDDLVDATLYLARSIVEFKGGSAPVDGEWLIPVMNRKDVLIFEQWPVVENDRPRLEATVTAGNSMTIRVDAAATDTDGGIKYQWFFGDLTFASGSKHTHTFRWPGTYQLIAYAADRTGNTTCREFIVTVPSNSGGG
jgi:hypothetical protein